MMQCFDHIIVGAGSAGCAVAGRLAELTRGTIAVIEAGPSDSDLRVKVPFGLVHLLGGARDWRRKTTPQTALNGRSVGVPRGRMIGGSGSINSMVWFRGCRADYDAWAVPGWGARDVWPAFDEVEARIRPSRLPHPHPLSEAFGAAIVANEPHAPPTPERDSSGVFHVNMKGSRRWSAADAFLRPAQATGRVRVLTGAEVDHVDFDGARASGVVLRDGRRLGARRGVVLSAGSIESPMILMRSGIGPGAPLAAAGIGVRCDLPQVGANLHDHPGFGLHFTGPGRGLTWSQLPGWALSPFAYALGGRGPLASNTVEAGAFFTLGAQGDAPDIQTHFLPFMMGWQGRAMVWGAGFFADVCLCRPRSRGRLSLGADRFDPAIDPGLLTDPWDLDMLTRGAERLRALIAGAGLGAAAEAFPGADVTGPALSETIRSRCGTAYHPVGTLALGGPVDADGRVRGVDGLWVADASLMPSITSANTNAPSMMLGWRAGERIASAEAERKAS